MLCVLKGKVLDSDVRPLPLGHEFRPAPLGHDVNPRFLDLAFVFFQVETLSGLLTVTPHLSLY